MQLLEGLFKSVFVAAGDPGLLWGGRGYGEEREKNSSRIFPVVSLPPAATFQCRGNLYHRALDVPPFLLDISIKVNYANQHDYKV
jgi:hypothetical protein